MNESGLPWVVCNSYTYEYLTSAFDHVEDYNPERKYSKETFVENYDGMGDRRYRYVLYNNRYVVSKLVLSREQYIRLSPYCVCSYHKYAWYNPMRGFVCKHCVGCVDCDEDANDVVVKLSIENYNSKNENKFECL